jgi:hypothetical protein
MNTNDQNLKINHETDDTTQMAPFADEPQTMAMSTDPSMTTDSNHSSWPHFAETTNVQAQYLDENSSLAMPLEVIPPALTPPQSHKRKSRAKRPLLLMMRLEGVLDSGRIGVLCMSSWIINPEERKGLLSKLFCSPKWKI